MQRLENGSPYLRLVISTLLGIGVTLASNDLQAQSYCNSSGCVVIGYPGGGGDGGWGGGGGGGWGGGITEDDRPMPPPSCWYLERIKPQSCPNPIPTPSGHDYGKNRFPGGSAVARAIYWVDHQPGTVTAAKTKFKEALTRHTSGIRVRVNSLNDINNVLINDLQAACDLQVADTPGLISNADRACLQIVDRTIAEANNRQLFMPWFFSWVDRLGIDLTDFGIPQTFINLLSPDNSLSRKYEMVTEDTKCSQWWADVRWAQCDF